MTSSASALGSMLRQWRARRRLSQLDLAMEVGISPRHMSFVETGRSQPSREVVMRLADGLSLTLRNRNALLVAAGFAPANADRPLNDPALSSAMAVIQRILDAHLPFPALAVDRLWTIVAYNQAVATLLAGVEPELLAPPANALRISLHPGGLAPRIANLAEWRHHVLERLDRQAEASGDGALAGLRDELAALPSRSSPAPPRSADPIAVPLLLDTVIGRLAFLSTTTVFGTPVEVTLSELAIETFFPADEETADRLRKIS